ncbi:MAG TPA: Hsp70 family protein [Actinophytocola sp.]|uniref:Hsp70 family protein n=1 Tax=Actinophytocola sp. TaxID=1872138 RepID=UPI002DBD4BB9|nr:Hsp70 family protein [Actinophytocola sp.]HEU5471085.1 Hsp70 family protein [Actinophytocola sp.]
MSIVVGIDLGTTNSCVAVPAGAEIPDKDALLAAGRLRPLGGALIVTNPDLSATTPSVVWVDRDGTPIVGAAAKRKARLPGAPPAMFFKRNMGSDQPVTAGHATLTPRAASVLVLRHLRNVVRDAIGVAVDRAVVTVPAFFETRAKNETTAAGAEAGLEVVETLIEPVAAALAYMRDAETEPAGQRRFLVYDLGGGTFDTSVVSWDPRDGFTSRSFDGDRFLGGYDFDRAIVDWIAEQVPAYDLRLGDEQSAGLLARLLAVAEAAKHDLSRETETDIIIQDLEDRAGRPMNVNLVLTRSGFDRLIAQQLRDTIAQCDQALARARLTKADLDEVVLVGGSSRIPLVAGLLAEHYGIRPRLSNPELCVAVGAALKADTASLRSGLLELDSPEPVGSAVDIGGRVLRHGPLETATEIVVELVAAQGNDQWSEPASVPLGDFLFLEVPLPLADNEFTIRVVADGAVVAAERITVRPAGGPAPRVDGDVLAHDFSVPLVDGQLRTVVKAGTRLPHRARHRFETASTGSTLTVGLYEGRIRIGTVTVPDLPTDVPPGTSVELTLEFEVGWTIRASVRVPHLDLAASALIDIPVRQVPPWPEIENAASAARTKWAALSGGLHPAEATNTGPVLRRRLDDLHALLAKRHDQAKAHYLLLEAQTMLQALSASRGPDQYLKPPWADFEKNLADLTELTGRLELTDRDAARKFQERRARRLADGQTAYDSIDQAGWRQVNNQLKDDIHDLVRKSSSLGIHYSLLPEQLRAFLRQRLGELDTLVRTRYAELSADERLGPEDRDRLPLQRDEYLTRLVEIGLAVDAVDLTAVTAYEELAIGIFQGRLHPLEESVKNWGPIGLH